MPTRSLWWSGTVWKAAATERLLCQNEEWANVLCWSLFHMRNGRLSNSMLFRWSLRYNLRTIEILGSLFTIVSAYFFRCVCWEFNSHVRTLYDDMLYFDKLKTDPESILVSKFIAFSSISSLQDTYWNSLHTLPLQQLFTPRKSKDMIKWKNKNKWIKGKNIFLIK